MFLPLDSRASRAIGLQGGMGIEVLSSSKKILLLYLALIRDLLTVAQIRGKLNFQSHRTEATMQGGKRWVKKEIGFEIGTTMQLSKIINK